MGNSHYFKEQVFLKVTARKYFCLYIVKLSSSHFWPVGPGKNPPEIPFPLSWWWDIISLKHPLDNVHSLMSHSGETMDIKFTFTSLLALPSLPPTPHPQVTEPHPAPWAALLHKPARMALGWWVLYVAGPGTAGWIRPQGAEVIGTEGKTMDLFCKYGAYSPHLVDLYWFQQYLGQALGYNHYRGWGCSGKGDGQFCHRKVYSKHAVRATHLYIRNLVPADTDLYHCALREMHKENVMYKNTSAQERGGQGTARYTYGFSKVVIRRYWTWKSLF